MSASPQTPFDPLFAQLTEAMSAQPAARVPNEVGTQSDTIITGDERVVWIPVKVATVIRPFNFQESVTPTDQAWDWLVNIYAGSLDRAGEIHALLVAYLDLIVGPEQGCAPSDDASAATTVGTVDLRAWLWPSSLLAGTTLDFTAPMALSVDMPAGSLAGPVEAAVAVQAALRAAGLPVLASLRRDREAGTASLALTLPADPVLPDAPTFTLDPDVEGSACALLGFTGEGATATGSGPTTPYRPGYVVGDFEGPKGGTLDAGQWALSGPVRLFLPVRSITWVPATVQRATLTIAAATSTGENIAVEIS